jgi:hypothetical protein
MADRVIKPDAGGNRLVLQDDGGGDSLAIETSQDVNITNGDIYFGTAGKGIVLGATSNVDANTLDDYEEGTFTPTIKTASATVSSGNMSVKAGFYTKVGRVVHITGRVQTSSISELTGTDPVLLGGLPFTVNSALNARAGFGWVGHDYSLGGNYAVGADTESNTTYAYLRVWDGTGGTSQMLASEWATNGAGYFSVSYVVA